MDKNDLKISLSEKQSRLDFLHSIVFNTKDERREMLKLSFEIQSIKAAIRSADDKKWVQNQLTRSDIKWTDQKNI